MRRTGLLWVVVGAVLAGAVRPAAAVDADTLRSEFTEDRTKANNEYRNQTITVEGKVTGLKREMLGDVIELDNAVDAVVRRHGEGEAVQMVLGQVRGLIDKEQDRVHDATRWKHDYEDRYRRNRRSNNKKKGSKRLSAYKDSMNPHGKPDYSLTLYVTATGTCLGVRDGRVRIDRCSSLDSRSNKEPGGNKKGGAGKKKGAKGNATLDRKQWELTGKIIQDTGPIYFAPDPDQYNLTIWAFDLKPKMTIGGKAVDLTKFVGRKVKLSVNAEAMKRGEGRVKLVKVNVTGVKPAGGK